MTLQETIYAMKFPSHEEVNDFILKLPSKNRNISKGDAMRWYAEMGSLQYSGMKQMFESRADADVIKAVGEMCYNTFQDRRQMSAVFYTFLHLVAEMSKDVKCDIEQRLDAIHDITVNPLKEHWNGIGDDVYGWRN